MSLITKSIPPICLLVGGVIGWFLTQLKLRAEIKKLKLEAIKIAGENLLQLQNHRRKYNDSCENCKQIASELIQAIDGEQLSINGIRERFCTAIFNKVIPNYCNLIEWNHLLATDNESIKKMIIEDVLVELKRFRRWISIANHLRFTRDMQLTPAKVNKRTLAPFRKLHLSLPKKDREAVEICLSDAINGIIEEGFVNGQS